MARRGFAQLSSNQSWCMVFGLLFLINRVSLPYECTGASRLLDDVPVKQKDRATIPKQAASSMLSTTDYFRKQMLSNRKSQSKWVFIVVSVRLDEIFRTACPLDNVFVKKKELSFQNRRHRRYFLNWSWCCQMELPNQNEFSLLYPFISTRYLQQDHRLDVLWFFFCLVA